MTATAVVTGAPPVEVRASARAVTAPPVPAASTHFPLFDGLRALAALIVLSGHASELTAGESRWYGTYTARPGMGVAVFFVISGFLLYRPFFRARYDGALAPRLSEYARRRVLRIVPAYWVALTVLGLWLGLPAVFGPHFFVFYGFGQVYSADSVQNGLSVAWTLCVEVSFYVLLPFYSAAMVRLARRLPRPGMLRLEIGVLLALALLSAGFRVAMPLDQHYLGCTLPASLDWFVLGMGLAVASVVIGERTGDLSRLGRIVVRRPSVCWLAAAVAFVAFAWGQNRLTPWIAGHDLYRYAQEYEHLAYGLVAFLIVLPAVIGGQSRRGAPRRLLAWRPAALLGLVSYGIYLWHLPLLVWLLGHGVLDVSPGNPFPVLLVVGLGLTLVFAAASWYLVERPLMRFRSVGAARRA